MSKHWKVLLIDDDAGIRRVTSLALEEAGYTVITAPDGETGIRLFKDESPHIVITDIGMPGIDGLEVLRRIKGMDANAEVIVATAFSETALAIKAMQLDAAGFVTKPVSDDTLVAALKRAQDRYAKLRSMRDYTALMEEKWMDTAEALAKTFQFQKMLIESSIDGIAACDERRKIIIFNRSLEEMLGYPKTKVIGKMALMQLFAPGEAERFESRLRSEERIGQNRLFPFEAELIDSENKRVPVLLSATVLSEGEEQMGMVVYFRRLEPIKACKE